MFRNKFFLLLHCTLSTSFIAAVYNIILQNSLKITCRKAFWWLVSASTSLINELDKKVMDEVLKRPEQIGLNR